ncbi:DUF881 domain-containing protein [bacterium]|nr:DUF881 domain-containing protein [bacterium]
MSTSLKIISILVGVLVGLLVMAQFRTSTPLGSSYPLDQVRAQKELIKSYIDDETQLKSRIVSLREKIDQTLKDNKLISQTTNLEKLNELKKQIDLSEIKGKGFNINLDDSPYIDRDSIKPDEGGIVYAADIRDIINLLRANNVEGIAVNDQRIIATSPITSVGNSVLINNSHLSPPFNISVIGDYESFLVRISDPGVLTDLQKRVNENGIKFSIKQSPHIILPIYNGQFRLKFIKRTDESTS